jgi:hypothetical protein
MYFKKLMLLSLICLPLLTMAQSGRKTAVEPPKNVFKVNFGSLILSNLSLSYERALGQHTSFQVQGNYLLRHRLPASIRDSIFSNTQQPDQKLTIDEPRFGGWGITPEFRWYFLKKQTAPKGLYAAAYLRTWSYSGKMDVNYKDQDTDVTVQGKVSYFAIKPGFQVGYQWLFGNTVSLDVFAGLNYGVNGIRGSLSGNALTEAYDEIVDEFVILAGEEGEAAIQLADALKELTPQNDKVSASNVFPTPFPGFRSGITLGIAF